MPSQSGGTALLDRQCRRLSATQMRCGNVARPMTKAGVWEEGRSYLGDDVQPELGMAAEAAREISSALRFPQKAQKPESSLRQDCTIAELPTWMPASLGQYLGHGSRSRTTASRFPPSGERH